MLAAATHPGCSGPQVSNNPLRPLAEERARLTFEIRVRVQTLQSRWNRLRDGLARQITKALLLLQRPETPGQVPTTPRTAGLPVKNSAC
jgi:hypothetical protein